MKRHLADTRPLANPHFRRLWQANIITVIGAQLTVVAVPAQIYAETGSSAYVGLTGVFGLVPLVVFGLWGGALADHFDRRTLLVVTTTGLIVTSALFWLQAALGSGSVWLLLGLFSVAAITVTAVGLHGLVAQAVAERGRDFAVRASLGARPAQIAGEVLRRGLTPAIAGLATGLILAAGAARTLVGIVYGVSPFDPVTFGLVALSVTSVASLACLGPAKRALSIRYDMA